MTGPVYRGVSRAIKVSPCAEPAAAPFPPGGEAGNYNGVSRAIKTLQNVAATGGVPQFSSTGGPAYMGVSRAIKTLEDCPQCNCLSDTFSRVISGSWGETELGPVGWVGTNVQLDVEDGVGKITAGSTGGVQEWIPGAISTLKPPYEYLFDLQGEYDLEFDTTTDPIAQGPFHYIVLGRTVPKGAFFRTVWANGLTPQGFVECETQAILYPGEFSRWIRVKLRVEPSAISGKLWYRDEPEPDNWDVVLVSGGTGQAKGFYLEQFERWAIHYGDTTDMQIDNVIFKKLKGDTVDSFLTEDFFDGIAWPKWTNTLAPTLPFGEAYVDGAFGSVYLDGNDELNQMIEPTNCDLDAAGGWRIATALSFQNRTERLRLHNGAYGDNAASLEIDTRTGIVSLGTSETANLGSFSDNFYNLIWEYVPGVRSSVWLWDNLGAGADRPPQPSVPTLERTDSVPEFGVELHHEVQVVGAWGELYTAAINFTELCPTSSWTDDFTRDVADAWLMAEGNCPPWTELWQVNRATPSVSDGEAHVACIGNQEIELMLDSAYGPWAIGRDFRLTTTMRFTMTTSADRLGVVFGLGLDFEPVTFQLNPRTGNQMRLRATGGTVDADTIAYLSGALLNVVWEHRPSLLVSRAKVWLDGEDEPAAWNVERSTSGDDYSVPLQRDGFSVFVDNPSGDMTVDFGPMSFVGY